jgi:group II intron reverse transcriptase/maturase
MIHRDQDKHARKLKLIAEMAKDKRIKFTTLVHLINAENLESCYKKLKKNKACGVDDVTVESYGNNLTENINNLMTRLKNKTYKPKPVKRVFIPKAGKDKLRPLGIPTVEDKLVQLAVKEILEAIYEQEFYNSSYGFRPNRSCHTAIKQLNNSVMTKSINYIAEVDIRKFFDNVDHEWMMKCLRQRIIDPNLLWLVESFLKSGIIEDNTMYETDEGTPQGGVISPLLANIYLHYVLDMWYEKEFQAKTKGYSELIRYCDDFVVACESENDAKYFLSELEIRLSKFNLEVAKDKTQIIKFGKANAYRSRKSGNKISTFNFLGFTAYWQETRNKKLTIRFKTAKQNIARKLKEINKWLKNNRNLLTLGEIFKTVSKKLTGHYNYFGVNGNFESLKNYYIIVIKKIFKWINRRSQKKSMNWSKFLKYLEWNPLPLPTIKVSIWNI